MSAPGRAPCSASVALEGTSRSEDQRFGLFFKIVRAERSRTRVRDRHRRTQSSCATTQHARRAPPVFVRDNTARAPCTPSLRARQHHVRAMHAQSSYATTPHARRARPVFLRDDTACAPRTPGLPARQHRVRAMHAHSSCGTTPRACHARPVFLRDNTVCAPCTAMRGQSAVGKNPPASRS
jgi:hypothetical protein